MPSEAHVESATMAWFAGLGYETAHDRDAGPDAEDTAKRLRDSYAEAILGRTLDKALASLNPDLPPEAIAQARDQVTRASLPDPVRENWRLHRALVDGVRVEVRLADGTITGKTVKFADF
ncbi:MAG: DEAD/DEAH box helicase, partial [Actinobacteria bacterium]|nr:DEAD/DEAH box helicase [Actinomycetota bacterium]